MALAPSRIAWILSGTLLSAALLLPLAAVTHEAFSGANGAWQHVSHTLLGEYMANSLCLAAGVAALAFFMGAPSAWFVTMYSFPGRRLLSVLLMMPLAIPAYIMAYIYSDVFAVTGSLQRMLGDWLALPNVHSLPGAMVVLALALYPYVYLMCRAAFTDQPTCALEAARVLGCSRWQAFTKVVLPMARPAAVAALALVVMETLADYGVSHYYGIPVLTTGIFRAWGGLDSAAVACRLALILLAFSGALMVVELLFRRRARFHNPTDRQAPLPVAKLHGVRAAAAALFCAVPAVAGFVIPISYLLYLAFIASGSQSTDAFASLLWQSFWLAALTAAIAMSLALFLQTGLNLHGGRVMKVLAYLVRFGYGVPGTVVGVGIMVGLWWLQQGLSGLGLSGTILAAGGLAGLVFAYLVRFMIMPLQTLDSGFGRMKPSMSEAARGMGLGGTALVRRVYLPMVRGGLLTGMLIVFVEVIKELPATLLLRPFDFNTLAVRTYELANDERLLEAAWPALAIVLICLVPTLLLLPGISNFRKRVMVAPGSYAYA